MKKLIILLIALFTFSGMALAENYKRTEGESIIRISDGASIPADLANRDYTKFQAWEAEGNTAEAHVAPVKTKAQKVASDADFPTMLERIEALEGTQAEKDAMKARIDAVKAKY